MAQYRDSTVAMVLLYFVAGFAGAACLVLLASNPIRCVLEYRVFDLTVALVLALLSGLGAALLALLPGETRRLAVSLYSGVVLALVGFIVLVWFLPSLPSSTPVPSPSSTVPSPSPTSSPPRPTPTPPG